MASLQMLLLYIKSGHTENALFRTLVDSWFAYAEGPPFVDHKLRPIWLNNPDPTTRNALLKRVHYVSDAAKRIVDGIAPYNPEDDNGRLVKDHSIPLRVLRALLEETPVSSIEDLEHRLKQFYCLGLITRAEDRKLARSKMPEGWNGIDPFARYVCIRGLKISRC